MFLLRQFGTAFDDHLVPAHAVVQLIVHQLVFVGLLEKFVLVVPVLGADSDCYGLVDQAVPDHSAEELVAGAADAYYSRASGTQQIPQTTHKQYKISTKRVQSSQQPIACL